MKRWLDYIEIDSEIEDYDKIHQTIEKDIVFKGTNLWILVFAIVVASVGLNMNSTAVIIGAMLISPLMGPINGLGYSIATYNFSLFRKALKNFSFAVIAGLIASSVYFLISPVSTAHSELLARTSPTIYDVIIALFGGLAGILAISSKQKGNVIPGVAIATALMPPLCTAGYGLATMQFSYFFGAFYLFTINTVFIAISAIVMSQVLKFPITTMVEGKHKKRVNNWITTIILVTIIPSIYFGYRLVQKERFSENAAKFTRSVGVLEGSYLLRQEVNADKKTVTMIYGGNMLTDEQKLLITNTARQFSIDSTSLRIQQGFSVNGLENSKEESFNAEINRLSSRLKNQQDSIRNYHALGKQLFTEVRALYPSIISSSYSESYLNSNAKSKAPKIAIVYITTGEKDLNESDKEQIKVWLKKRLNSENVKVVFDK